jgi:hypothetical protein
VGEGPTSREAGGKGGGEKETRVASSKTKEVGLFTTVTTTTVTSAVLRGGSDDGRSPRWKNPNPSVFCGSGPVMDRLRNHLDFLLVDSGIALLCGLYRRVFCTQPADARTTNP